MVVVAAAARGRWDVKALRCRCALKVVGGGAVDAESFEAKLPLRHRDCEIEEKEKKGTTVRILEQGIGKEGGIQGRYTGFGERGGNPNKGLDSGIVRAMGRGRERRHQPSRGKTDATGMIGPYPLISLTSCSILSYWVRFGLVRFRWDNRRPMRLATVRLGHQVQLGVVLKAHIKG